MITTPRVFAEDHVPRRLQHREAAVDELLRAWGPAVHGDRPDDILLHGPSGVGKTVLSRHALDRLQTEAPVRQARVRCLGKTTAGVVRGVLSDLGADPASNTPLADLREELTARVDGPVVAVLDEADDLPATDAVDVLTDAGVAVVPICHDPDDWLARADRIVRERFHDATLGLDRYGVSELADILAARARAGLHEDAWTRSDLERLADDVAGVARAGIQSLREAARQAEARGHDQLQESDLADGPELARRRIREGNLHSLPLHHQVLYAIIRERGQISAAELHETYDAVAADVYQGRPQTPISRRARRSKLSKLADYDLLVVEGAKRHREYRVADRDVGPPVAIHVPAQ